MKTRHERGKEPDGERGESMERHVVGSPEIWSGVGEMKHGVPNAGPRVKFMSRTDHALRLRTRSLTGLATGRDDVVRAQAARAVEEPDATEIAPKHSEVLIADHGHVGLDVDVSFAKTHGCVVSDRPDGVEADILQVGTGTAVHPGGGADGDDQATGTKCGSGDHIDKSSGIRRGPESGP